MSFILLFCSQKDSKTNADSEVLDVAAKERIRSQVEKLDTNQNISVDFITGHFDPSKDSSFVLIPDKYSDRHGMYMKKEAFNAFKKMYDAAKEDNINLVVRSATRNFDYQKGIWERKWKGEAKLSNGENAMTAYEDENARALKILEYSSMPGTSRHHWGTDIDLNNFNNEWFESGEGLALFTWLENNAEKFGFCRPYTTLDKSRPFGYNEEKWHWSYTPLSDVYTSYASKYLKNKDIHGFAGSAVASKIDVVSKYVLGINQNCNH